jgi:hypothetical protein
MVPKIRFAVGIFILILQMILYLSADYIYGPYASVVRNVFLTYFILLALLSPYVLKTLLEVGPNDIPSFSIGFILTVIPLVLLPLGIKLFTGQIETGLQLALGFGLLHSLVKAFDEEIIFRGALPKIIGIGTPAMIVTSVLFGIFHFGVLMLQVQQGLLTLTNAVYGMILLMGLGFVWALVAKKFGLLASTGSHFAYNLSAMGVLNKILGGA